MLIKPSEMRCVREETAGIQMCVYLDIKVVLLIGLRLCIIRAEGNAIPK